MSLGTRSRVAAPAIALAVVVVDQLTKFVVRRELGTVPSGRRLGLWEPVLALEYVENRGAAFGIFAGAGLYLLAAALIVAVILGVVSQRMTIQSRCVVVGLGLVLGGALGNAIDRLRLGYVVDFVAVGIWPKFNIADSAITVGVLLFLWATLRAAPESESRRSPVQGFESSASARWGPAVRNESHAPSELDQR